MACSSQAMYWISILTEERLPTSLFDPTRRTMLRERYILTEQLL
jgi:hypothetical protein